MRYRTMLTTIQLHKSVVRQLLAFRETPQDTYEAIITRLMAQARREEAAQKQLLKEGYVEMARDMKKMNTEWEAADAAWD